MHVCFKDIMHFLETMDMGTHTFHLVSELNVEMFKWKLKCQEPSIFYGYIKEKKGLLKIGGCLVIALIIFFALCKCKQLY